MVARMPAMLPLPPDIAAQNQGPAMMGVMYSFTALSCLTVVGRITSRHRKLGHLFIDDYVILLSLGFVFAYVGFMTVAISAGSGRHAATLSFADRERAMFFTMIGLVPGVLSVTVPKFAVVSLLTKILFPSPWHVWLLWGLAISNLVLMLTTFVFHFSECDPPSARWTVDAPAKCSSSTTTIVYAIVVGGYSAVVDFYLVIYPAIVLWSMSMHLKKKLALSVALGFGAWLVSYGELLPLRSSHWLTAALSAGVAAVYKLTIVPSMGDGTDYTYDAGSLVIWISVETNSVIIAACIPMLLPFLELLFGKRFLSAPRPASLSLISDASPGSTAPSAGAINKPTEAEHHRTSDEVEERMGAVLLFEETSQDEERGRIRTADPSQVDNIRQRKKRPDL